MKKHFLTYCVSLFVLFSYGQDQVTISGKTVDPAQIEQAQINLSKLEARLEGDPTNTDALLAKCMILERLAIILADSKAGADYFAKAEASIKTAIEQSPIDFRLNMQAGQLYYRQALLTRNVTSQMKESDPEFKNHAGKLYRLMESALPYFETAYAEKSDDADLKSALKDVYLSLGLMDEASGL